MLTCKLSKSTEYDADRLATLTTRPPSGARAIRLRRRPVITYGASTFTVQKVTAGVACSAPSHGRKRKMK